MFAFVVRRLLTGIGVLLGATALSFFVIRVVPGDAVTTLLGGTPTSPEVAAQLRAQFHTDRPVLVQYGLYMRDLSHGDFGISMQSRHPVKDEITARLPSTMKLTGLATILALGFGVGLGLTSSFLNRGPLARAVTLLQF